MRTNNYNVKILLTLILAVAVLTSSILSVEANVRYISEEEALKIDFSDAYIKGGYFYLPLEEEAIHNMFRMVNYPGYIDETTNEFIALGTRDISQNGWFDTLTAKVPLNSIERVIYFNNMLVFSYGNDFAPELFRVPVMLNGKEVIIDIVFERGKGRIDLISDENDNEVTLKEGDVIQPIYKRFVTNDETEDFVVDGKKLVYHIVLAVTQQYYVLDNYAFKLFAQTTSTEGHCYSEAVVPKTFVSANPAANNSNTGTASVPSEWAKAEIDKAKENELTTERVLRDYQKPITREEFCELTVNLYEKLSGKTAEPVAINPFNDTENVAVLKAYNLGIVNGTGNGQFSPDKPLNREQMAKMFFTTIQLVYPNIGDAVEDVSFTDKDQISVWAKQAVNYMFKEKIILGSDNKFNPKKEASREQAIVLVNRVFEKFKINQ